MSKHAVRLLNHPEPANGDRCRRLLLPERGSLDAARRQTYARAHVGSEELAAGFVRHQQSESRESGGCFSGIAVVSLAKRRPLL